MLILLEASLMQHWCGAVMLNFTVLSLGHEEKLGNNHKKWTLNRALFGAMSTRTESPGD